MVIISEYQVGDVDRMVEIAPNAFGVWARYGIDRTLPRDRVEHLYREEARSYAKKAERGGADFAVFAARQEAGLVGYIVVGVDDGLSELFGFKWGRLISLAVDPPHQGQRTGPKLVDRAMSWFRENDCRHVEVWTDINNIAAIRTYEGAGFRVIYSGVALTQWVD